MIDATLSNSEAALRTWVQPLELRDFMERHWRQIPYWAAPDASRLRFTETLLPTLELSGLLEHALEPIKVWYRDGDTPVYSFQLGRSEALHAYRAGLTLYFHLNDSVTGDLVRHLSSELGRPPFVMKVSVFAGRRGGKTMPHVDGCENFTVHLQGKKLWRISPGEECPQVQQLQKESKEFAHTLYQIHKPPDFWDREDPMEMTPGAFLYCPANYWHTVDVMEDSLSFNVSIGASYTWADALLPAIRAVLMTQPEWRSPDVGLWSSGDQRKLAQDIVQKLVSRLSQDLRDINSEDVLSAWTASDKNVFSDLVAVAFVRNPLVSCEIVFAVPDNEFRFCIESNVRPGKKYFLTMDWKYYKPFLTLVSDRAVRYAEQFKDVPELVSQLLLYGVLRPCSL